MLRASGRKTAVFSATFSSMDARSKGSNRGFRTTLHAANERAGPFAFGLWSSVLSEYEVLFLVAGFRWPTLRLLIGRVRAVLMKAVPSLFRLFSLDNASAVFARRA